MILTWVLLFVGNGVEDAIHTRLIPVRLEPADVLAVAFPEVLLLRSGRMNNWPRAFGGDRLAQQGAWQ